MDADPRVASLIAALKSAEAILEAAKATVHGIGNASDQVRKALVAASRPGVLNLKDALIQGSLKKAILGTPAVAGFDFEVLGQSHKMGMAFSLTDPAFDADQLSEMALFIAWQALKADHQASALLVNAMHDAYVKKHDAAQTTLQKALKDNGLD
ncbi:MAG: hypothetical protein HN403_19025 [Rhodospirillales bacterium]|nr:hypothetical protein [Rhodospirillales bacterium]